MWVLTEKIESSQTQLSSGIPTRAVRRRDGFLFLSGAPEASQLLI